MHLATHTEPGLTSERPYLICGQMQMKVPLMYLDAADKSAHKAWASSSLKFYQIFEDQYQDLQWKHTLVHYDTVYSRLLKSVPSRRSLLLQVLLSPSMHLFAPKFVFASLPITI